MNYPAIQYAIETAWELRSYRLLKDGSYRCVICQTTDESGGYFISAAGSGVSFEKALLDLESKLNGVP